MREIFVEPQPLLTPVHIDDLANKSGVPHRKARIVMVLLKRHGLVREHRGCRWERLRNSSVSDRRCST